jgi:hypothetical protein
MFLQLHKAALSSRPLKTFRMQHFIGKDGSVFDLVVQRKLIKG